MLTLQELNTCLPIGGAYPMSLLKAYFGLILSKDITDEDVWQIIKHHNEQLEQYYSKKNWLGEEEPGYGAGV